MSAKTAKTAPVKKRRGRPPKGMELRWVEPFLAALPKVLFDVHAARIADVAPSTVRQRLKEDAVFAERYRAAFEEAVDNAELALFHRGVNGTLEPVFYKGRKVAEIRKYDTTALIAFLNARRSQFYRQRHDVHAQIEQGIRVDLKEIEGKSAQELAQLYRERMLQPSEN